MVVAKEAAVLVVETVSGGVPLVFVFVERETAREFAGDVYDAVSALALPAAARVLSRLRTGPGGSALTLDAAWRRVGGPLARTPPYRGR